MTLHPDELALLQRYIRQDDRVAVFTDPRRGSVFLFVGPTRPMRAAPARYGSRTFLGYADLTTGDVVPDAATAEAA